MMIHFLVAIVILAGTSTTFAQECLEVSEQQIKQWKTSQPELPDISDLYKAKKLIDAERKYSLKLGGDKRAHCYLGCRISHEVNFETARYAAWQKEYNDATDCDPKSLFEIADYEATLKGASYAADIARKKISKKQCVLFCKTFK
jgi:hypothetical protein